MIFEILLLATFIITIIVTIVRFIRHQESAINLIIGLSACLIIVFISLLFSGFYVGTLGTNSLEPIKETELQLLDDKYIHKTNETYYFKYDNQIVHSESVRIVNIDQTNLEKPKIFICQYKHSFLVPKFFSNISEVYLVVVPKDELPSGELPYWLNDFN